MEMLAFSRWANALPDCSSARTETRGLGVDQDRAAYDERENEGDDEATTWSA